MINSVIIIDDFIKVYRRFITITSSDVKKVDFHWNREDKILIEISKTDFFKNKTKWCELSAMQYKFLISSNLKKVEELAHEDVNDNTNPVVQSLIFLLSAFIKCVEDIIDMKIETLKIQRLVNNQVVFSFFATVTMEILQKSAPNPPVLRIVVDNSND